LDVTFTKKKLLTTTKITITIITNKEII